MHDIMHRTICQSRVMTQISQNGSYSGWGGDILRLSSVYRWIDAQKQHIVWQVKSDLYSCIQGSKNIQCKYQMLDV